MYEARFLPQAKKEKPRLTIYYTMANFVKKMKIGEKGNMNLSGIISSERKSEDDKIYKTLKIEKLSLISGRLL